MLKCFLCESQDSHISGGLLYWTNNGPVGGVACGRRGLWEAWRAFRVCRLAVSVKQRYHTISSL